LLLYRTAADADDHHLGGNPLFFEAHRFFHGDFAEGVHRHLDVGKVNAGVVRLHANLDVEINHTFYRNQYFHSVFPC
jgi:hypothetical protein